MRQAEGGSARDPIGKTILTVAALTVAVLGLQYIAASYAADGARSAARKTDASISSPTSPQWIWAGSKRQPNQQAALRRDFEIAGPVRSATLRVAGDFVDARVWLNGKRVGRIEPFGSAEAWEVAPLVRSGEKNVLAISGASGDGPAAVMFELTLVGTDDATQQIVSDKTCVATLTSGNADSISPDFESQDWQPAATFGDAAADLWTRTETDVAISPLDDYTQWMQALKTEQSADPAKFLVPDGFQIELLRSAASDEGSWIGIACDERGRLLIGREDQGILRVTLSDESDNAVQSVESINDTLKECRGLVCAHDSIYVSANTSQGIYRLRDEDGDDQYEKVDRLCELPGGPGHGRNSLALGPDGMIYSICGDAVDVPGGDEVFDFTSPLCEHRRGEKTKEGFLHRFDREGNHRQIICTGLRNPYGIAFSPQGEVFTYDADAEKDMGAPWYRPTRVVHLVSGADYGWRGVTGQWPPYYPDHPDNGLPVLDIGKGSPTAVMFGTASNFPPAYRQALFILDWAYGRIVAVHLTPRGASYAAHARTFVKGRPFNVTSLCFGRDGAMYVVTGGRKTQSGLYRIRYVGPQVADASPTSQQQDRHAHAEKSRALRLKLEKWHGRQDDRAIAAAWPHLDSPDPWIRHAARVAIEHQPIDKWRDRALEDSRSWGTLTALLALARCKDARLSQAIVARIQKMPWSELSDGQRIAALYAAWSAVRTAGVSKQTTAELARQLEPLYPDNSPEVNIYLGRLIVEAAGHGGQSKKLAGRVIEKTLARLDQPLPQAERMHYLYLLRDVSDGWTSQRRETYFDHLPRLRGNTGGEGMPGFVQHLYDDALAALPGDLPAEFRERLVERLADKTAIDNTDPLVIDRPLVRQWRIGDVAELLKGQSDPSRIERGRQLYAAALCSRCHRFGGSGYSLGPDLTGVARRFSRRDILESILDPSKVVAEQYRTARIETSDGRVVSGRLVDEADYRSPTLHVATNPLDPRQVVEVTKSQIEVHQLVPVSFMPEGLLNTLTREEILDLLAYLETGDVK